MQFRNTAQEELNLNLAPLIDVVFLLLIFFMVTTSFTKENALDLTLPEGSFEPLKSEILSITISINKLDEITFESQDSATKATNSNSASALAKQIQSTVELAKQEKPNLSRLAPVILIKADRAASHGRVVQLMDAISKLGISKIQFVAVPVRN